MNETTSTALPETQVAKVKEHDYRHGKPGRIHKATGGKRGFASLAFIDPERHKEIASLGGKTAHAKGVAHEFTHEEAVEAGRKGGMATHKAKKNRKQTKTKEQSQDVNGQGVSVSLNGVNGIDA